MDKCPNCNIEFSHANIVDIPAGDILITVDIEYCSQCLYIENSEITLSN